MENIISPNIKRTTGKDVWRENIHQAIFAANKIRSTLGPMGAYKMVTYNRGPEQVTKVTKDAIAILDELAIQYPPAVIIAESAKMQRAEAGDGASTFVVFLSALLKRADELKIMGVHANTIIHGYHLAMEKALEILEKHATSIDCDVLDTLDCGRNLLTPSLRLMIREAYPLAFTEGRFDRENIRFIKKKGGQIQESSLIRGVVVKKEKAHPNMPDRINNLRIAITSQKLGINRLEVKMRGEGPTPIVLNITSADQISKYKQTENRLKTQHIKKLTDLKINVLLCEQPLDDQQKSLLVSQGVFALENVDKKDAQAVSKATGATIVGNIAELTAEDVGVSEELSTDHIELEKTVTLQGCRGATFLLRGNLTQSVDELENAIQNSLTVLKLLEDDNRVLPGAGATEAKIAQEIKQYAKEFSGREQLAIEAFSRALMEIPRCLAENNGLNPVDVISQLKLFHADGQVGFGVSEQGCSETVCLEPLKIKRSVIRRAYEVSSMMLRIDELLMSKEIAKFHKK